MTLTELYKNLGSVENARNILACRNQNQPTATHFMHHPINPVLSNQTLEIGRFKENDDG